MSDYFNPFEYEAASKLLPEKLLEYYIEDFNYSRFIHSTRNVFLVGERGTGKTMALRYNSLPVRIIDAKNKNDEIDLSIISIYVPCNTPLTHKREYELIDNLHASMVSEHFLVISIMDKMIESLSNINNLMTKNEESDLKEDLSYVLGIELPEKTSIFKALHRILEQKNREAQEALNKIKDEESFLNNLLSFNSGLRLLLTYFKNLKKLSNSHFSLMLDDIHYFNIFQTRALNSWISYRDNSLFSFKVATTRVEIPSLETASGGNILEGHDFTRIDMEQPYQNKISVFGKMAKDIIMRRLKTIEISKSPEEYFPINKDMLKDLGLARKQAIKEAEIKFPSGSKKQKDDYIYKYDRAIYFRNRASQANIPPYSGFELLVHLSTGVIRNLLDPCYYMYDRMYSEWHSQSNKGKPIFSEIPPTIQSQIIEVRSTKKWEWFKSELHKTIEGCSLEDAKHIYQLLDNLAILFKKRLLSKISEPRAVVFTISGYIDDLEEKLDRIIKIARKAQLIYTFTSSAKDLGRRETYYMPNRILWPIRGLDPIGQHARVSIKAEHLWNAAKNNKPIPFDEKEESNEQYQLEI